MTEEECYRRLVDKLKLVYDSINQEHRDENGKLDEVNFREAFEATHEKNVIRRSTNVDGTVTELNYDELLEAILSHVRQPTARFKLMRYKRTGPNSLHLYIRIAVVAAAEDSELESMGDVFYNLDTCKIYLQDMQRAIVPVAPGQLTAAKSEVLVNAVADTMDGGARLTARDLARRIFELPSLMNGRVLGDGTPMMPTDRRYNMLRIFMHFRSGAPSLLQSMLGMEMINKPQENLHQMWELQDSNEKPYANGAFMFKQHQSAIQVGIVLKALTAQAPSWILCDDKNQACAVCQPGWRKSFFDISAPRPLVGEAQDYPSHLTCKVPFADTVFYPWFRIISHYVTKQSTGKKMRFYFVLMLTELNAESKTKPLVFEPLYTVMPANQQNAGKNDSSSPFAITNYFNHDYFGGGGGGGNNNNNNNNNSNASKDGSLMLTDYYSGDHLGVITKQQTLAPTSAGGKAAMPLKLDAPQYNTSLRVDAAPGVDPAMMLCIAASLNDMGF